MISSSKQSSLVGMADISSNKVFSFDCTPDMSKKLCIINQLCERIIFLYIIFKCNKTEWNSFNK